MDFKSANDICLKKGKTLCVIYITNEDIDKDHVEVLKEMS
jgi:hypothetical protein